MEVRFNGTAPRETISFQLFGGENRPEFKSNRLFNDPSSSIAGFADREEFFPGVTLHSSFIYLNQPSTNLGFTAERFKNDYVADIGIFTHPLTDKFTVEAEYGKSSDDNGYRGLVEYRPYWGRVMLSFKQLGENYINPATFFLLRNYRETNFITEYQPNKKLGFNFDYELSQFGDNPVAGNPASDVHSFTVNSVYQKSDTTNYVTSINVIKTFSDVSPQEYEKANFIYQHFYRQNNDQFYAELFGQHSNQDYASEFTSKFGGGVDTRYTKNFSRVLQLYLQNELQMNQVRTSLITASSSDYIETALTTGPTLSYILRNKTLSGGFFYNLNVQGSFDDTSNLFQPFVSFYYNPSQALSLGTRINYNQDFGKSLLLCTDARRTYLPFWISGSRYNSLDIHSIGPGHRYCFCRQQWRWRISIDRKIDSKFQISAQCQRTVTLKGWHI